MCVEILRAPELVHVCACLFQEPPQVCYSNLLVPAPLYSIQNPLIWLPCQIQGASGSLIHNFGLQLLVHLTEDDH